MKSTNVLLPADDPMMVAWKKFCETDEFKNALRWANETKYDDGRPINEIQREEHAKGAMWLAFTKGMEENLLEIARLKAGEFTKEEIHDICHNLEKTVSPEEFATGCAEQQKKLYGISERERIMEAAVIDLRDPQVVEVSIKENMNKIWVNVDGRCRFRAYEVGKLTLDLDDVNTQLEPDPER